MNRQPGFIQNLRKDIERVSDSIRTMVDRHGGLREENFFSLLMNPNGDELRSVDVPNDMNVSFYHDKIEEYSELGKGQKFVHCIYAGETDVFAGNPKALLRVPGLGISLLAIKLLQTPKGVKTAVIVPPHLKSQFEDHVSSLFMDNFDDISIIEQDSVYLLTPDYRLVKDELISCGSGGCISALIRDGFLQKLSADGTDLLYVTDVCNVFSTPSDEIMGHHVKHGSKITFEVVRKMPDEHGSVLVDSENGINLVNPVRVGTAELSEHSWMGTGAVVVNTNLDLSSALPLWRRVRRVHKNYITVCYQRFLEELSEAYTASYVGVARDERFLTVSNTRDMEEISKRLTIKFSS